MIRPFLRRHPLLRFLGLHLLFGIAVAALAVAGLIALDTHGLRRLILNDQSPVLALVLLAGGFVLTFGSILMGSAIMTLGGRRDPDGGTTRPAPVDGPRPIPVEADRRGG